MTKTTSGRTLEDDLYATYEESVSELFEQAKSHNRHEFLSSLDAPLVRIIVPQKGIPNYVLHIRDEVPEMEIAQVFMTVQHFEGAVRDEKLDKRIRTPLALMLSFHLLGADIWHSILGNLLNVVIGHRCSPCLFRGQTLSYQIEEVRKRLDKCEAITTLSMSRQYRTICNEDVVKLRNAFSDSQYLLTPQGDLALTEYFMGKQPKSKNLKRQFSFGEIQDIFRRTLTFLTVLARLRRQILRKTPRPASRS